MRFATYLIFKAAASIGFGAASGIASGNENVGSLVCIGVFSFLWILHIIGEQIIQAIKAK